MKAKNLLFLLYATFQGVLYAQTDFRPGYVIKVPGDTLYGEIDYRGDVTMHSLCRFRICKDSAESSYSPDDIIAYRFRNDKYYISKKVEGRNVFLEFLVNGIIDIYYTRDNDGDHYYIEKKDAPLSEIPYEEGVKYKDDKHFAYQSTRHMGFLKFYMQDVPEFEKRIQSIKKPEHRNLVKLAEDYHHVVCKDEECIVYEKKMPLIGLSFETVMGMLKYNEHDKLFAEPGLLVYIWAPRSNEKLYFKTGLSYHRLFNDKEGNIFKIPLQLQYLYPSGIIRPKISIGMNLYTVNLKMYTVYHTTSLNAGLNFHIYRNISICTNFNSEYTPLTHAILHKTNFEMLVYSFSLGMYFKI